MAIEVIVTGLGMRGRDWVCEVMHSPGYQLVGCVDTDQAALDSVISDLQVPRDSCFSDLRKAIDQTAARAVIIATPADRHVSPCEIALSKRLAVLVEKPFTTRLKDAIDLVSYAETQRAPLLVAQNYRYLLSFRTARRVIGEGGLGRIGLVVGSYYRPPHNLGESLARLEHSVIWGMAIHHLDAFRCLLDQKVTSVVAESFSVRSGVPRGASFRAMLSFEDGTRALYSATYESSGHQFFERGQEFYLRFVGERATLHVFHRWLILCENGKLPRMISRGRRQFTEEAALLRQFEGAILFGGASEVSGRDNLQTMAVVEACLQSVAENKPVNPQDLLHQAE